MLSMHRLRDHLSNMMGGAANQTLFGVVKENIKNINIYVHYVYYKYFCEIFYIVLTDKLQ